MAENEVAILRDYTGCGYEITRAGKDVAVLGLGNFHKLGSELLDALAAKGIRGTLVNPRGATVLDADVLENLKKEHRLTVTLEDGVIDGGFGEKIARYYGTSGMKVLVKGAPKQFADRYDYDRFLRDCGLTVGQMADEIAAVLG